MELLILWILTIIASFAMEIANELRMFKDAADVGYKIDIIRFSNLSMQINPNGTKITFLSILMSIFNMMQVSKKVMQYNNDRQIILDQLDIIDVLEKMSEKEREEYLKKPTGLNALIVTLKSETQLSKAPSIKINDGNEHGEIYYKIGKSLEDITILKVNGSLSRLSVEEQKRKVIEVLKTATQGLTEKNKDIKPVIDILNSGISITTSDSKEAKKSEEKAPEIPQESRISEQRQALEILKTELLEREDQISSSETDRGPKLSKKIK